MSVFLGASAAAGISPQLQASDGRVCKDSYSFDFAGKNNQSRPWGDGILWSWGRGLGSSLGRSDLLGGEWGRFDSDQQDVLGGSTTKKIIGTSRDSNGSPLGSCLIQGFLTATGKLVGSCVSDSGGYFELPTNFTDAHYLVAYRSGSPDVAGSSVNTIIPA